jgi:hypothetical protein
LLDRAVFWYRYAIDRVFGEITPSTLPILYHISGKTELKGTLSAAQISDGKFKR